MIEEKFSELVDLYLDKEISKSDFELLKLELNRNSKRRGEFQERCHLHQAMRLALGAPAALSSTPRANRSRSGGTRTRKMGSRSGARNIQRQLATHSASTAPLPKWALGAGVAACLTIGGLLLLPVFTDTTHISKGFAEGFAEGFGKSELGRIEQDPLDLIKRSDLRRFADAQARRDRRRSASLAAELRLLGMSPDVAIAEVPLEEVSLASVQPRDTRQRRIEMLNQLQEYSPIPEHPILQSSQQNSALSAWPSGFQSSLASFK